MSFDLTNIPTSNAPLDPAVKADLRRKRGDQVQIAWDGCAEPHEMLTALLYQHRDLSVLLPPARFIEVATQRFQSEGGGTIAPLIWTQTMRSASKMLCKGSFYGAVLWLQHAYTGAGFAFTPDQAHREMAGIIREFFPEVPATFAVKEGAPRAIPMSMRPGLPDRGGP